MAFKLGNFAVQEILLGLAENFDGDLLYTLDQLTSAQIEVSSDPQEITDKNGNIIRQIYRNKTATFTASSALLSPNIMNASSGSDIKTGAMTVPKVEYVAAGGELDVTGAKEGTINMIGVFGNGANGKSYSYDETAALISGGKLKVPANKVLVADSASLNPGDPGYVTTYGTDTDPDAPIQYVVKYEREITDNSAIKLSNEANVFPKTVKLTFLAAIVDPCKDTPRAAIIEIPSFQADPSMTVALDAESTTIDFSGSIQVDYCGCEKNLYNIYIVDEDLQITSACAGN